MPGLMRAVLRAERALGEPLMRATNSREAAGALLLIGQAAALARDGAERTRSAVVHALALPSHRDLQKLDAKVERLQRMLEELTAQERA